MKIPRMVSAIGHIDDDLIAAAEEKPKIKRNYKLKWGMIAACFAVLAITGTAILPMLFGGETEIPAPPDESYIKTHEYQSMNLIQSAGWPTMEKLCSAENHFIVEFTVAGEYRTYERTYIDEENFELDIAYQESIGNVMSEEEKEEYKEKYFVSKHTSVYLPVKFGEMYLSGNDTDFDLNKENVVFFCDFSKIKEQFPVGAKFLMLSWESSLEYPLDGATLKEYVFYIDSENKLTPVYDIPTTADYAGYTVEEFVEAVRPYFEAEKITDK